VWYDTWWDKRIGDRLLRKDAVAIGEQRKKEYRIKVQMTIEMPERAEFLDSLGRFGVSPFQYGADDIVEEANRA